MNDISPYIVFAILAMVIGAQLLIRRKALQARGKSIHALNRLFPNLPAQGRALVFCHSPGCPPCKAMQPHIDHLAEVLPHVYSLDISRHTDLARAIGIRATPTTLLIEDGRVSQVLIGQKKPAVLQNFLEYKG
ncbi:thioredoxin family protein [Thiolapillus sp.]